MPEPAPIPVFGDPRAAGDWAATWRTGRPALLLPDGDRAFGSAPPVCVAVERFPEEWPPSRVRALLAAYPLSVWVIACGRWAAGGNRTGSPWPAAVRCDAGPTVGSVSPPRCGANEIPGVTDGAEAKVLDAW